MDVPPALRILHAAAADFRQAIHIPYAEPEVRNELTRKTTRNGYPGYAHLVEVDVPVARGLAALTDPGLIRIWSGQEGADRPSQRGLVQLGDRNAGGREAHIDIFRREPASAADLSARVGRLAASDSAVSRRLLTGCGARARATTSLRVLGQESRNPGMGQETCAYAWAGNRSWRASK